MADSPTDPGAMTPVEWLHSRAVVGRRVQVLAHHLAELVPPKATVLDIGAGDGLLASALAQLRPDVCVRGVDVIVRPGAAIHVERYDGLHLPNPDRSVDVALLVDVLHHTGEQLDLLRETARVAREVVIKDHLLQGLVARPTLRLMDSIGNARHGVALPYCYWERREWETAFEAAELRIVEWRERLGLYPIPLKWLFERSLHFMARLRSGA